nr:glycosyltransferase family 39 protein [uncultured Holophaga sp.]
MIDDQRVLQGPGTDRRALLLLLLFGLIILGAGLGLRDPWPADEPRFALVARQMVDSGHWLFPMRGGELYPDKPPVFMWAIACFYQLTGSLRVAFLLPSFLASMGTLALVFDLGRRLWDRATGWRAGLVLLLVIQFTLQAHEAQIDALVTFFIILGVYGLMRFLRGDGWRWYLLGWFAAGLGVITKGVGILALFVLLPALWTHRRELRAAGWKAWLKGLCGPLLLLAAVALWAVPMLLAVQTSGNPDLFAYRNNILFHQTVTRYGASWHHRAPWYYYLVSVAPEFWMPLSLAVPWLIRPWYRAIRKGERALILLLGYVVLVLVFFSCSPGKRMVYITPAVPALALAAAPWLPETLAKGWARRLWWALAAFLALVSVALPLVMVLKPRLMAKLLEAGAKPPFLAATLLGVVAIATLVLLRKSLLLSLGTLMAALWVFLGCGLYPAINGARTPKVVMDRAAETLPQSAELLIVAYKEQFLLFSQRPLLHFPYLMPQPEQAAQAAEWQGTEAGRWVLGPERFLKQRFDLSQARPLGRRHGEDWLLLPPGSARPGAALPPEERAPIHRYDPRGHA